MVQVSPADGPLLSNIGQRIFGGRVSNEYALASGAGSGRAFAVKTVTAAKKFSAVRLILAVGQNAGGTAITPTVTAAGAALPNTSDAAEGAAAYVDFTFNGAANTTLPPSANQFRRAFVLSDWAALPSVSRDDGGEFPLLSLKAYISTTGTAGGVVLLGSAGGTDSFAAWATRPDGRIWQMYGKGYAIIAATAPGMVPSNSAVENRTVIVGYQYIADGKVQNVIGLGNSITEGRGTYIGEGWGFPACVLASNDTQRNPLAIPFEWSNLGWSGFDGAQIAQNALDAAAAGLIGARDIVFLPWGSPNDFATTITPTLLTRMKGRLGVALGAIQSKSARTVRWSFLPTNPSVKAYGATDQLRRDHNDAGRATVRYGEIFADFDVALAGITDPVTLQTSLRAGTSDDGIHPNDAGNALLAPLAERSLFEHVRPAPGILIAP